MGDYTPDRGTVRYRYADGDFSGGCRDPHAEFDRFIAKVESDVLRKWADDVQTQLGVIENAGIDLDLDYLHGIRSAISQAKSRADQIEADNG